MTMEEVRAKLSELREKKRKVALREKILGILHDAQEPLETKEIEELIKKATRTKILYRLNHLRAEQKVQGKVVGSGKGTWIWWLKQ